MKPKFIGTNDIRTLPESEDCTVRAFASACSVPYNLAHEFAARAGRIYRKGFWSYRILDEAKVYGMLDYSTVKMFDASKWKDHEYMYGYGSRHRYPSPYPTLAEVMPLLQQGRFVLETATHALAVVDGTVFDNSYLRMRLRIQTIFEIKLRSQS